MADAPIGQSIASAGRATTSAEATAWELFGRAPAIQLAGVDDRGEPLLRTVHAVVLDGCIAMHGGDHGEKLGLLERPVVASVYESIARIPSYFIDPELACPATTYFRSASAHGVLRRVVCAERKVQVLQALMDTLQPEGRHLPIRQDSPRYAKVIEGLLVAQLRPERMVTRVKLGQNRGPATLGRVVRGLWRRGDPGDVAAMHAVHRENPGAPLPRVLRPAAGCDLIAAPTRGHAEQVATLLQGAYWLVGVSRERVAQAHLASGAWVVAVDASEQVVASARAVTDGARRATLCDVIVAPGRRGSGLGRAVLAGLLDHPAVRRCDQRLLWTRDAQRFYTALGFREQRSPYTAMVRSREP